MSRASLAAKRFLGAAARRAHSRWDKGRRIVLTYHAIGNGAKAISAAVFHEHMRVLHEESTVISPKELLSRIPHDNERLCAITFDDGYCGVYEHAADSLALFGFTAALFVCSALLDAERSAPAGKFEGLHPDERLLSWLQVQKLSKDGFIIGSHLTKHMDITAAPDPEARNALSQSKQTIETTLGSNCELLAYPWGYHDARAQRLAAMCGYRMAFTTEHACVQADCDALRIPRMNVSPEYEAADLTAMIRGDWDFLRQWGSLRSTARIYR